MSNLGLHTDKDCTTSLFCCNRDLLSFWRWPWRDTPLSWRPWRGTVTHAKQLWHDAHIKKALLSLFESNPFPEASVWLWLCVHVSSEVKNLTFGKENTLDAEWITSAGGSSNVLGWLMVLGVCCPKSPVGRWLVQDSYNLTGV